MYTTLIVWVIIIVVVLAVVLLSKNNIVRLLILASIVAIFFTTFSQFLKATKNTAIENKIEEKIVIEFDKKGFNEYKKINEDKIEYKGKIYSVKEIRSILKIPYWLKPDVGTAKDNETLSEMIAKNSSRAIMLAIYFLLISLTVNILFQILFIVYKRIKK